MRVVVFGMAARWPVRRFVRRVSRWTGPRWMVAVLAGVIVLQLGGGLLAQRSIANADRHAPAAEAPAPQNATTPGRPGLTSAALTARTAAVRDLLQRHAAALLRRDRAGFLATIDPRATAFRARQAALFDNLAAVPLSHWSYTLQPAAEQPVVAEAFARYGGPVWAPQVTLSYALRDFDAEPTGRPQYLTFVQRDERWYVAADDDFVRSGKATWRGLWDFGPVVVHKGQSSLLLAHPGNAERLPVLAEQVEAAIPRVTAVWGPEWSQRVVVLIPDTQQEMTQVIGGGFALSAIAAVATSDSVDGTKGIVRGQRVLINPANLDRLGPTGRRVVLRHEITHIATRAVTGPALPSWLVEGFADYVGYLGSGLTTRAIAPELRAEVRQGKQPTALPADTEFRFDNPRLSQAYEQAWLACRLIARLAGQDGLVRLYREVGLARGDGKTALDRQLRQVLDLSLAEFTQRWRDTVATDLA